MSKHTPGPWTYTGSSRDEIIAPNVIVMEDDGGCGDPECCGPARYWVELSSDNARLIAASPCLLTAAIEAMSAMDNIWQTKGREDDWIYDEMGSELSAGYFSLRAAIAKARGDA